MSSDGLRVGRLRCEHLDHVLGVHEPRPRLSWELTGTVPPAAHRVVVATDPALLDGGAADLWDSGRCAGTDAHVEYDGPPLRSGQRAHWLVEVEDDEGTIVRSATAWWEAGLLQPEEWLARWIGPPPAPDDDATWLLATTFDLPEAPVRARLHSTALGLWAADLNDRPVTVDRLTPGWTDYRKRLAVQTHDVTHLLRPGPNELRYEVANGWYAGWVGLVGEHVYGTAPELLAQLHVDLADGTRVVVATGDDWTVRATGRRSDLLMGETVDLTAAPSVVGRARLTPGTSARLVATTAPPVRVLMELPALARHEPAPGVHVLDVGQNVAGWARVRVTGGRGDRVTLRFAEVLEDDGGLHTANLRTAAATDVFVLRGDPAGEVLEPRFTTHGFRYVEVTGVDRPPALDDVTAVVAGNDLTPTGTFQCSDPLVNRLHENIVWGQRGNFLAVPTDCPQRDERLGWTGDLQVFAATACFNADIAAFASTWLEDMAAGQTDEGAFPVVAPRLEARDPVESDGAPGWGDAGVIVPWTLYERYGDRRMLERCYPSMVRWVDYVHAHNPDLLWRHRRHGDMGDWLSVEADSPKEVLGTSFFAWSATLTSRAAHALGRTDDASRLDALAAGIRDAYRRAYVADDGNVEGGTQTVLALALRFGLVPDHLRAATAHHLVADIERRDWHLSTGFLGVAHLLPALTETGHLDVAYRLLHQETWPSWLHPVRSGATTIWERWDGWTEEHGLHSPGMNSFNHYAFGAVGEWLYETVAGIRPDPARPGYEHVLIDPRPGGRIEWVEATFRSVRGPIEVRWDRTGGEAVVPPGVTADLRGSRVGSGRHAFAWEGV